MKTTGSKKRYEVEAFAWIYGERVVKRTKYTHAYSEKQAIYQAFKGQRLPDSWSVSAKAVQ